MNNVLIFLTSSIMINFYIKFIILIACCKIVEPVIKSLCLKLGYEKNKTTMKCHIKNLITVLMLFIPYVGWIYIIVLLFGVIGIEKRINEDFLLKTKAYHKIK